MNLIYLPNHEKLKSFLETFTRCNQMLIFEELLYMYEYMSNMDFIFEIDEDRNLHCMQQQGNQQQHAWTPATLQQH
jgi:hypothetical protein